MATPGIGDPYWFEWYVGLKNIINMLNPDNGIEYVIFVLNVLLLQSAKLCMKNIIGNPSCSDGYVTQNG